MSNLASAAPWEFPCGKSIQDGVPPNIVWSNCESVPITLHVDYLMLPDQDICLEAGEGQGFGPPAGTDADYAGVNNVKDVTLVKEGC